MTGLSRTATVDLGPLVAAYLSSFLPDWQPTGVDMRKVDEFRRQLVQQLPQEYDHTLSPLAQDVVVALGNRASQLGAAAYEWGSRTALLALGDPALTLNAIAAVSGAVRCPRTLVRGSNGSLDTQKPATRWCSPFQTLI